MDRSFVNVSEPLVPVTSNEYVHAMVRVQVIVYVNDVDMSKVFVMGTVSFKELLIVSVSSRDRSTVSVAVASFMVFDKDRDMSIDMESVRVSVTSEDSSCVGTFETVHFVQGMHNGYLL